MLEEPEHKKRKIDVPPDPEPTLAEGKDAEDIIVVSSGDEDPGNCTKKRCKENPQCLNYLGQIKLEKGALGPSLLSSESLPSNQKMKRFRHFIKLPVSDRILCMNHVSLTSLSVSR